MGGSCSDNRLMQVEAIWGGRSPVWTERSGPSSRAVPQRRQAQSRLRLNARFGCKADVPDGGSEATQRSWSADHTELSRFRCCCVEIKPATVLGRERPRVISFPIAEGSRPMDTRIAPNDDAAPSLIFGTGSGEELAGRTFTTAGASLGPVRNHDGKACASVVDRSRPRADRATIVNRMLDWSDEARATGRVRRAEYLVCLAWDAYERVSG